MANPISRLLRKLFRRRVPAGVGRGGRPGEAGGSAGVREPRRPKPTGPQSLGAKPIPSDAQTVALRDPRQ